LDYANHVTRRRPLLKAAGLENIKPRVCVDFDGVIFDGSRLMDGCLAVLSRLRKSYSIAIYSARATDAERNSMKAFLDSNAVPYDEILEKPEAVAYIDDKAVKFEGWACLSF
jgi:ribonucleotide monophosphatase NagD (HAD superfamily)